AECGEPAVAPFPAVAIGAMKHRASVARLESANRRYVVHDSRGEQQVTRPLGAAVRERDLVMVPMACRAGDADTAEVDPVSRKLAATQFVERGRRDAVSRQIAVHRGRAAIARLAEVAGEHATAAAA